MYRIEIDQSLCSGFGSCAELAPDTFVVDADGRASTRTGESPDGAVVDSARSCPMGAIVVYDIETGERAA